MKDKLFIEATITWEHKSTTCKIFITQTEIFKVLGHLIWDCENTQVISWSRVDNKFVSGNIIYKWGQKKKKMLTLLWVRSQALGNFLHQLPKKQVKPMPCTFSWHSKIMTCTKVENDVNQTSKSSPPQSWY